MKFQVSQFEVVGKSQWIDTHNICSKRNYYYYDLHMAPIILLFRKIVLKFGPLQTLDEARDILQSELTLVIVVAS